MARYTNAQAQGGWMPSPQAARRELKRARRQRARRRRLYRLLVMLLAALLLGWGVSSQLVEVVRVTGSAMSPAMRAGSVVVCLRRTSPLLDWLREKGISLGRLTDGEAYQPGEIVLFDLDGQAQLRRVMALEGQRVSFSDTDLLVDGVRVTHETERGDADYPLTVSNGEYFVMGDARALAPDSRLKAFGCVRQADIRGRAVAVIWPFWAAGVVRRTMNP